MNRPEVKIVEYQSEQNTTQNFSDSEKNYLLSKYGYDSISKESSTEQISNPNDVSNLTYDEFLSLLESKKNKTNIYSSDLPKSYTFENVKYHESRFKDLELDGFNFGIKIQVVSDMPINHYR